jgi:peptidoglycan LD-endopeptidase LytH
MIRKSRFLFTFGAGAFTMLLAGITFEVLVRGAPSPSPAPETEVHSSRAASVERPLARSDISPSATIPPSANATTTHSTAPAVAGRLLIPVQGVAAASLVDTYEHARGEGRRHDAIDIMAPRGTPVLAAADGVVMKLFQSELGGITLYQLAPDRRTIYYYAHLDRYSRGIAEGRALRRGEVLGYVGNTGSAGPGNYHLHFEISTTDDPTRYWGGVPRNPYPLLQ